MVRRSLSIACCFALGASMACERLEQTAGPAHSESVGVANVVARVGGHPIVADEVRGRMALDGVEAQEALDAVIAEQLLLQEALRRGLTADPAEERRADRMLVRALLHDLERNNEPEDVSVDEVRQDFRENEDAYEVLEKRDSWHILVKDDSEAASVLAHAIVAELLRAKDPRAVFQRYENPDALGIQLPLVVEELPPITRKARMENAYKDALFGAKALGPLRDPVQTGYGWHAIVLTEIEPGRTPTWRDVESDIRERLSQKRRFESLVEIVQRLEGEGLVSYQDEVVDRLLTAREVPGRAE